MFRADQLAGGVYSFFENLLRGFGDLMDEADSMDPFDLTVFHGRAGLRWHDARFRFHAIPDRLGRFAAEGRIGAWDSRNMDAVLFPNYFTPPVVRARSVFSVIHDLQYCHMPELYSPAKRVWLRACHLHSLRRCDAVVTISETVKQDLLQHYGTKWERRVVPIHNPVSVERFSTESQQRFTNDRPYVMCVAMDRPQKNLFTLIHAFDLLKDRFPDHMLVLAGQLRKLRRGRREGSAKVAQTMPSTEDLVAKLGLQDRVVVTGFISDSELGALYRGTSVFVLPSLFEGFGMPAVEAMALGAPTLVSDLPVLREVTLNQAHYVKDPHSPREFADRIADVLQNEDAARPSAQLVEQMRHVFSPRTVARKYYELLAGS
jgi:glycosyltransferase involved in cell wall biosynthesis